MRLIAHANPGDILVLTSTDPEPYALIGELMTTQAQVRGVAGILVDGAVRDLDELAAMGLPDLDAVRARTGRGEGRRRGSSTCRSSSAAPRSGRATSS